MIPQLSRPMNEHLKLILQQEHLRLMKESKSLIKLSTGGHQLVTDELVVMKIQQVKIMYRLLFNEEIV